MKIFEFGLNHKIAPFALLERMSFSRDGMDSFLAALRASGHITEAFGLSTCNRTEFLLAADTPHQALSALFLLLRDTKGVDLRAEGDHTFFLTGDQAIRHVFHVACGVDSLVIGENEILGQMRTARELASDAGHIGELLDPILLRAIDVGRRARQATSISRGNVSVASVAATQATRLLGDLSTKDGVVLGAGETAEAAVFQLTERGLKNLTIANRTYEKAHRIATAVGAREAALDDVGDLLKSTDVVVCATGAQNYIVSVPMVEAAMDVRPERPLLLLDVSVPRNVDPMAAEIDGVHIYTLEHLTQLAEENRVQRESQVRKVEDLVEQELITFQSQRISQDTLKLVAALHKRVEQVRLDHIARHGHYFGELHRDHLDTFSAGLTRSMLHDLVENLRTLDLRTEEGRERFRIAQELFNVAVDDTNSHGQ